MSVPQATVAYARRSTCAEEQSKSNRPVIGRHRTASSLMEGSASNPRTEASASALAEPPPSPMAAFSQRSPRLASSSHIPVGQPNCHVVLGCSTVLSISRERAEPPLSLSLYSEQPRRIVPCLQVTNDTRVLSQAFVSLIPTLRQGLRPSQALSSFARSTVSTGRR